MKLIKLFSLSGLLAAALSAAATEPMNLWYEKPAQVWEEALPIANGSFGAMVYGKVHNEVIPINDNTLWSGRPQTRGENKDAAKYIKPIRKALAEKDFATATKLCKKLQGEYSQCYLPLGDVILNQLYKGAKPNAKFTNYTRTLCLDSALVKVRYRLNRVYYERQIFVSAPDSAMVIKISAEKPGMVNLDLGFNCQIPGYKVHSENGALALSGAAPVNLYPVYYEPKDKSDITITTPDGKTGMRYISLAKAVSDGGWVETDEDGIHVRDANSVTLYITSATSFNGPYTDPDTNGKNERAIAQNRLNLCSAKDFSTLKSRHVADFASLFHRVTFTLNNPHDNKAMCEKMPSDLRLRFYDYGNQDSALETMFFQFGRYLLISSSRGNGAPANLQGIWNPILKAPWSSNYTININTEMNYWPAEPGNLSEMTQPLLNWVKNLAVSGAITAKDYYNCKGWVAHHNSDIWCLSNAVGDFGDGDPQWANWALCGAWLSRHLWDHYLFTLDKDFLKEAYPVMKGAAEFCSTWLVEKNGYLITSPSTSPENSFYAPDGNYFSVCEASTMDMAIIKDVFDNVVAASEVLGIDKAFRKSIQAKRDKLYPYHIGSKGQLLEWGEEYTETDPHHRHLSHLYGLHPGTTISPITTPDLAQACNRTFEIRGDEGTGWSKGWKINFAARLLDGDHAYKMIREIMHYFDPQTGGGAGGTYPNFFDAHPPFQIDGNFGATAGIMEMLMQSHLGEIHLLPALPSAWPNGEIKGIKARGNFEVNIAWKNGALTNAAVKSVAGAPCVLRTSCPVTVDGVNAESKPDGKFFITSFPTEAGKTYSVKAK